jgi:surface antigen
MTRAVAALSVGWALCAAAGAEPPAPTAPTEGFGSLMEPVSGAALEPAMLNDDVIAEAFNPRLHRISARYQCVPYAREMSGVNIRGNANTWWAQAQGVYKTDDEPSEGAVIVMRGYTPKDIGHVAVIRKVVNSRKIIIDHANWLNKGEITLSVPVWDVSKKGDWSEVRVWHVPGQHWGKRVYGAQGFILPVRIDGKKDVPLGDAEVAAVRAAPKS